MPGPSSPFDDPVPRGQNVVLATLRIAVALECWGAAGARLYSGDDFGLLAPLVRYGGFAETTVAMMLDRLAWGLCLSGFLTLVRPCWPVLTPVTLWFVIVAAAGPALETEPLRPVTHGARCLTPLCLLLLDFWPPRVKFSLGRGIVSLFFLRLGIILTAAGQGYYLLQQSRDGGPLLNQLTAALRNVGPLSKLSTHGPSVLGILGGLSMGLAIGLVLVRSRGIALLMVLYGTLAAMSYVVAGGSAAWPAALLHTPLAGASFALFLHWWLAVKEQPAITLPA